MAPSAIFNINAYLLSNPILDCLVSRQCSPKKTLNSFKIYKDMEIDPNSEDFVHSVLMPLSMRLKNGENEQVLKDELLTLVLPWVRQQVSSNIRRIPVNADPANVSSHMHEAAFKAVAKIDWQQIDKWPMYLGSLVRHSAQEAARDDDYLSRQQRVLRKQFRNACIAE